MEKLEPRLALAAFTWIGPEVGAWNNPTYWNRTSGQGEFPMAGDQAFFEASGPVTVIVPSDTVVGSLQIGDNDPCTQRSRVTLQGGVLTATSISGVGFLTLAEDFHLKASAVEIASIKLSENAVVDTASLRVGFPCDNSAGLEVLKASVRIGEIQSAPVPAPLGIQVLPTGVLELNGDVVTDKLEIFGHEITPGVVRQDGNEEIRPPANASLEVINGGQLILNAVQFSNNPSIAELKIQGSYTQTSKRRQDDFDGKLEFVFFGAGPMASNDPPPAGRLHVFGDVLLGGKINLHTDRLLSSTLPGFPRIDGKPRSVGWAPLLWYESLEGRFDQFEGSQLHYRDVTKIEPEVSHDRFLGLNYQEQFIDVMFLETPRVFREINSGNWEDDVPNEASKKYRLTPTDAPKSNLVLIVPGTADSVESKAEPLAKFIADAIDSTWDVAVLEWNQWSTGTSADPVHPYPDWKPWTGSTYGINIGESLAHWLKEVELQYSNIHLLSHSGGTWLIDALADELNRQAGDEWIHATFFDAFAPDDSFGDRAAQYAGQLFNRDPANIRRWGDTGTLALGDRADYAEHFFDSRNAVYAEEPDTFFENNLQVTLPVVPLTDATLPYAYNMDVTMFDPQWVDIDAVYARTGFRNLNAFGEAWFSSIETLDSNHPYRLRSHSWPVFFYLESAQFPQLSANTRYEIGFPSSSEWSGRTPSHALHPRGQLVKLGFDSLISLPIAWEAVAVDAANTTPSTTGTVTFNPPSGMDVQLVTGSPVSISTTFSTSQPIDLLEFDFDFLSQSQGRLTVLLDGEEVERLDEEPLLVLGSDVFQRWPLNLPERSPAGQHVLTLHLDPLSGGPSRIELGNVRWGQKNETPIAAPYPHPWTNYPDERDVDNDGFIAPIDALRIINELNAAGARPLSAAPHPKSYVDVNGDNFLAPIDALIVINYINSQTSGEGEQSSPQPARVWPFSPFAPTLNSLPVDAIFTEPHPTLLSKSTYQTLVQSLVPNHRLGPKSGQFAKGLNRVTRQNLCREEARDQTRPPSYTRLIGDATELNPEQPGVTIRVNKEEDRLEVEPPLQ